MTVRQEKSDCKLTMDSKQLIRWPTRLGKGKSRGKREGTEGEEDDGNRRGEVEIMIGE